MNLVLAIVWFLLGVVLLGWELITGNPVMRVPALGNISAGWLALPMCLYNLARWSSERAARRAQEASAQALARRHRFHSQDREPGGDIDPTFDFTADPPRPPQRPNITDQPPSAN